MEDPMTNYPTQDRAGELSFDRGGSRRRTILVWLWSLAMLAALLGVAAIGYRKHLIDQLRLPLLAQISDPGAAQFRNERLVSDWTLGGSILCGQVDTSNRLGGSHGFRNFVALTDRAKVDTRFIPNAGTRQQTENCPYKDTARWWHLRW
jgi:hypothetical protein